MVPTLMTIERVFIGETLDSSDSVAPSRAVKPEKTIIKPMTYWNTPHFQSYGWLGLPLVSAKSFDARVATENTDSQFIKIKKPKQRIPRDR